MEWCHENVAWLLSSVQTGGNNAKFWASFEDKFHKENLHFRG